MTRHTGVAVDSGGNVFVAGYIDTDGFLAKHSANGVSQWPQTFGSDKNDGANALCADAAGNLYVAGNTSGVMEPDQSTNDNTDGFLRRYSANGSVVWTRQFEIGDGSIVSASCSAAGSVFLTGRTTKTLPDVSTRFGSRDAFVIEYGTDGEQKWSQQFGSVGDNWVAGVSVAPGRKVWVAGNSSAPLPGEADFEDGAFLVLFQR
jgi:hypothetical protein